MAKRKIYVRIEQDLPRCGGVIWLSLQTKGVKTKSVKNSKGKMEEREYECMDTIGNIGFIDFTEKELLDKCIKGLKIALTEIVKDG